MTGQPCEGERAARSTLPLLTVLVIGPEDSDQFPVVSQVDQHLFCAGRGFVYSALVSPKVPPGRREGQVPHCLRVR